MSRDPGVKGAPRERETKKKKKRKNRKTKKQKKRKRKKRENEIFQIPSKTGAPPDMSL